MRNDLRRRWVLVVAATAILVLATGCTTSSSTDGSPTRAPLDKAALIKTKQNTADVAKDALRQLSAAGASVQSAVGSWNSCADVDPTFGQYIVIATVTIPVAAPAQQMNPLVAALRSAGWNSNRETAPKGNELADLRKADALLQLATDGSPDLQADLIGPCVKSDLIGTEGFRFPVDQDKIDVG